jgi:hypothetical protein
MTKAREMKRLEKAYHSGVRVERSTARMSGPCLCRSMVGLDGGIDDAPTIVVLVATASIDHKTIFCRLCGAETSEAINELVKELTLEYNDG